MKPTKAITAALILITALPVHAQTSMPVLKAGTTNVLNFTTRTTDRSYHAWRIYWVSRKGYVSIYATPKNPRGFAVSRPKDFYGCVVSVPSTADANSKGNYYIAEAMIISIPGGYVYGRCAFKVAQPQ